MNGLGDLNFVFILVSRVTSEHSCTFSPIFVQTTQHNSINIFPSIYNVLCDVIFHLQLVAEIEFQNGKIAFRCTERRGRFDGRVEYVKAMSSSLKPITPLDAVDQEIARRRSLKRNTTHEHARRLQTNTNITNTTVTAAALQSVSNRSVARYLPSYAFYAPVTVHANYCGNKTGALLHNGLWLVRNRGSSSSTEISSANASMTARREEREETDADADADAEAMRIADTLQCRRYSILQTSWGHPVRFNWTRELLISEEHTRAQLSPLEGRVVRFPMRGKLYLMENSTMRLLPFTLKDPLFSDCVECAGNVSVIKNILAEIPLGKPVEKNEFDPEKFWNVKLKKGTFTVSSMAGLLFKSWVSSVVGEGGTSQVSHPPAISSPNYVQNVNTFLFIALAALIIVLCTCFCLYSSCCSWCRSQRKSHALRHPLMEKG
jgi:hypothetical protein